MLQILHIFRKDGRRHRPEILISLLLLGLYARLSVHPWENSSWSYFGGLFSSLRDRISLLLVLFWCFLIVRVVQGEPLVGDRQWWVTRPYVWWKLFLAKILFVFIIFCVPLFFVQLYFLEANGFPLFRNIGGIVGMQLGLGCVFFLPSLLLGALTRSLGQAAISAAAIVPALLAAVWLVVSSRGFAMTEPPTVFDEIQNILFWLFPIGVLLWQFARRRTWHSRGILFAGIAIMIAAGNTAPDGKYVENEYPQVESNRAPAILSLRSPAAQAGNRGFWRDFANEVQIGIPLRTSGVADGSVVLIQGMKLTLTTPDGAVWTRGWRIAYSAVWPGDERKDLIYEMTRKDFERWKNSTVRVQIELAMTQYAEDQPREITLTREPFFDTKLGMCRIDPLNPSYLECLEPFRAPGFMATADPRQSPCYTSDHALAAGLQHALQSPIEHHGVEPGISPITRYQILFQEANRAVDPHKLTGQNPRSPVLCSGAKLRIADPKVQRRARVELEIPSVALGDLVNGTILWP
jgi:hypothetical protein